MLHYHICCTTTSAVLLSPLLYYHMCCTTTSAILLSPVMYPHLCCTPTAILKLLLPPLHTRRTFRYGSLVLVPASWLLLGLAHLDLLHGIYLVWMVSSYLATSLRLAPDPQVRRQGGGTRPTGEEAGWRHQTHR